MGLNYSPRIVNDGLIFYYDMLNTCKSWKGAPTTNLYGDFATNSSMRPHTLHFTNGEGWLNTDGYTVLPAPSPGFYLGKVYKFVSGALSSTWSGNSYGYMYKDLPSSSGQAYTMSFWAYVSHDCNIDALPATSELTSGYAPSNLPTTYNMSNKGTWQRIGVSSTGTGGNTRWLVYPQKYGVTDGSFIGYFLIAGVTVETGTVVTPYAETSRSNTQVLLDLTNTSATTASGLVYNTDGTFQFDYASSSHVSVPLSTALNKLEGTINLWVYPMRYNGGNGYFVNRDDATANAFDWLWIGPYSGTFYFRLGDGGACCNNDLSFTGVETIIPLNTWSNMTFTWKSASTSEIYINGALLVSRNISAIPATNPAAIGKFGLGHVNGDNYFNGKMPVGQIYNRQLSAAEVKQNFNALRGRYGI